MNTNCLLLMGMLMVAVNGLYAGGSVDCNEYPCHVKCCTNECKTDCVQWNGDTSTRYGGTITFALTYDYSMDEVASSPSLAFLYVGGVSEKLASVFWEYRSPGDESDFPTVRPTLKPALAESWSQLDPLTYLIRLREGVRWHDKLPLDGRELTAQDIVHNLRRIGLDHGSTGQAFDARALDELTVEIKVGEPDAGLLRTILDGESSWIYPPEVINDDSHVNQWQRLVGTGPMVLSDWIDGDTITWTKNCSYWGHDERYPQNTLPYVDKIVGYLIPDHDSYLAAFRTGKLDYIGPIGGAFVRDPSELEEISKVIPNVAIFSYTFPFLDQEIDVGSAVDSFPIDRNQEGIGFAQFRGYSQSTSYAKNSDFFRTLVNPDLDWSAISGSVDGHTVTSIDPLTDVISVGERFRGKPDGSLPLDGRWYAVVQPWIHGFDGHITMGRGQYNAVLTRLWTDHERRD